MVHRAALRAALVLAWAVAQTLARTPALAASAAADPSVILLSFDGTRPDQIRRRELATFARLLREGAAAGRMDPVFPTNTFPNHASLVTGVAPERHGIVSNVFVDPERGLFDYAADPTWLESQPLWSILAEHGVPSASFHWVASEGVWRDGRGPVAWKRFDPKTSPDTKLEQVLAWLDRPPGPTRPRLVTVWLRGADHEGHRNGPDSDEVLRDLVAQDASLGRLVAGLEQRGLLASTTLLVVSDHGMARAERAVDLAGKLRSAGIRGRTIAGGGFAMVRLAQASQAGRAVGIAQGLGLEAFERRRAPRELRLGNDRFGDVVVIAPVGTVFLRDSLAHRIAARLHLPGSSLGGAHGYRPEEDPMGAIFLAFGRGAPAGAELGRVSALDVAPTVLALLGVPVPGTFEGKPIAAIVPPGASPAPVASRLAVSGAAR
jgi:arylsulfatase A-like enzyme